MKYAKSILLIFCFSLFSEFVYSEKNENLKELIDLAKVYKYIDIDSASYFCDKAYPQALLCGDPRFEVEILILKSGIHRRKGDYKSSITFAKAAKEKSMKMGDKALYANSLLAIAGFYLESMSFDLSYENYISALKIFLAIKDKEGECWCYSSLGVLMSMRAHDKESLEYFHKAHAMTEDLKDPILKAAVLNNLGVYYYAKNDMEESAKYIRESLKVCEARGLTTMIIYNYANLALMASKTQNYEKAIDQWERVERLARSSESKYELVRALNNIGILYHTAGNETNALKYIRESYEISMEIGSVEMMKNNLYYLSEIHYRQKDLQTAYHYACQYNAYTDSLNNIDRRHDIMKLKYEYEYQREKEQSNWENKIRNSIIVALLIILSLILISVIAMRKRSALKIKNMDLEREKLQAELDHKSREMTTKLMYLQKKNDLITLIADKLQELKPKMKIQNRDAADEIIKLLKSNSDTDNWKEFELRFEEVYGDFLKKLNEQFPNLTPNEKKLCAYLKLNMTTKEIASLLYLSVHSVDSARYRLRKKLNLTNSEMDINTFLEKF